MSTDEHRCSFTVIRRRARFPTVGRPETAVSGLRGELERPPRSPAPAARALGVRRPRPFYLDPHAKFRRTDLTGFQFACAAQRSIRVVLVGALFRVREKGTEASVGGPSRVRLQRESGVLQEARSFKWMQKGPSLRLAEGGAKGRTAVPRARRAVRSAAATNARVRRSPAFHRRQAIRSPAVLPPRGGRAPNPGTRPFASLRLCAFAPLRSKGRVGGLGEFFVSSCLRGCDVGGWLGSVPSLWPPCLCGSVDYSNRLAGRTRRRPFRGRTAGSLSRSLARSLRSDPVTVTAICSCH